MNEHGFIAATSMKMKENRAIDCCARSSRIRLRAVAAGSPPCLAREFGKSVEKGQAVVREHCLRPDAATQSAAPSCSLALPGATGGGTCAGLPVVSGGRQSVAFTASSVCAINPTKAASANASRTAGASITFAFGDKPTTPANWRISRGSARPSRAESARHVPGRILRPSYQPVRSGPLAIHLAHR